MKPAWIEGPANAESRPAWIERLAYKYRSLGSLRRARARGEPIPDRAVFRALAAEFPGALNELDNLPLDEIDRRLAALTAAAAGGPCEAWMGWMHRYHALMRAALYVKIRVARVASLSPEDAAALAEKASAHAAIAIDSEFVAEVKAPLEGRLNRLVFQRLAAAAGVSADEIRRTLFPRRGAGGQR